MKKLFKLEELDCANCAAKIQDEVSKIDGVNEVSISFMTQSMFLDCEDDKLDEILKKAEKTGREHEKGFRIIR